MLMKVTKWKVLHEFKRERKGKKNVCDRLVGEKELRGRNFTGREHQVTLLQLIYNLVYYNKVSHNMLRHQAYKIFKKLI